LFLVRFFYLNTGSARAEKDFGGRKMSLKMKMLALLVLVLLAVAVMGVVVVRETAVAGAPTAEIAAYLVGSGGTPIGTGANDAYLVGSGGTPIGTGATDAYLVGSGGTPIGTSFGN
jgi:hypothetical protein